MTCTGCPYSGQVVVGGGDPGGLLVVGGYPPIHEGTQAFSRNRRRKIAQVLHNMIGDIPLYWTYAVKCRPAGQYVEWEQVHRCWLQHLRLEVMAVRPQAVLALNLLALTALLEGDREEGLGLDDISKWVKGKRRKVLTWWMQITGASGFEEGRRRGVFALQSRHIVVAYVIGTVSPEAAFRNPQTMDRLRADLDLLAQALRNHRY